MVEPALLVAYLGCWLLAAVMVVLDRSAVWAEIAPALGIQLFVGLLLASDARQTSRQRRFTGPLCVAAYLFSVALMRDATGTVSGFGPLALLPVAWTSLRGRRGEMILAVFGIALIYLLPAAFIGSPQYPAGTWRGGVLFTVTAALLGAGVLRLVARVDTLVVRLGELARTDELTRLPNRRAWRELLDRELAAGRRMPRQLVVVLLDLDSFKDYNDTNGHPAGDRLLHEAAKAWLTVLREGDVLARWGGDEFGLLLPDCDTDQADRILDRMRATCPTAPFSAGAVLCDAHAHADTLLAEADRALYRSKQLRSATGDLRIGAVESASWVPQLADASL